MNKLGPDRTRVMDLRGMRDAGCKMRDAGYEMSEPSLRVEFLKGLVLAVLFIVIAILIGGL